MSRDLGIAERTLQYRLNHHAGPSRPVATWIELGRSAKVSDYIAFKDARDRSPILLRLRNLGDDGKCRETVLERRGFNRLTALPRYGESCPTRRHGAGNPRISGEAIRRACLTARATKNSEPGKGPTHPAPGRKVGSPISA
jgi:hypothetical protein